MYMYIIDAMDRLPVGFTAQIWSKNVNGERNTPDRILIGLRTHLIVLSHEQYKFCVCKSSEKR